MPAIQLFVHVYGTINFNYVISLKKGEGGSEN
jgi:hypothetical protein